MAYSGFGGKGGARLGIVAVNGTRDLGILKGGIRGMSLYTEPRSGMSGDKIKQSSLHKKSELPVQNGYTVLYTNYSCFARPYRQSLPREKPRGETEEEGGVLEYDSPSSSEDSKEESFVNNVNNDETDDDVSGEIPSLDDQANFRLGAVYRFGRTIRFNNRNFF